MYNKLQTTSCDVGMHFGNVLIYSVKIENLNNFRMPSGKRWVHSVSGRHNDDRQRNDLAFSEGIRNIFKNPILTNLYRLLTEIAEVH